MAAASREDVTYAFAPGYLEVSFRGNALSGQLGENVEEGRLYKPSPYTQMACIASTPNIPMPAGGTVDVDFEYRSKWREWALPSEAATEEIFAVIAGPDGAHGMGRTRSAVTAGDLGPISALIAPFPESDGLGWYTAGDLGHRVATLSNIQVPEGAPAFAAHVCMPMPGAHILIEKIVVRIRHGQTISDFRPRPASGEQIGPSDEMIMCAYDHPVAAGCGVAPRVLAGTQEYQSEFRVQYAFVCPGEPLGVTLRTEMVERSLRPSTVVQEATLTGADFLRLELSDPMAAHAAFVVPGCSLRILGTQAVPSVATLAAWNGEGLALAGALFDRLALVRLAQGVDRILEWDEQQLGLLRPSLVEAVEEYLMEQGSSWRDCGGVDALLAGQRPPCEAWASAMAVHPEMLHYLVLLIHVQAMVDGRPAVSLPMEVAASARELRVPLAAHYTAALRAKVQEAEAFRTRLRDARQVVRQDLDAALAAASAAGCGARAAAP